MKKTNLFLVLIITCACFLMSSCDKDHDPVPGPDPVSEFVDTAEIKLKEYKASNLPSPLYHFTYDNAGYVTAINYGSGMLKYTLEYENKRLKKLVSQDGEHREYAYSNGRVTAITGYETAANRKVAHNTLAYDQLGRLVKIEWFIHNDHTPPGGMLDRTVELSYYTDGNLREYKSHIPDPDGVTVYTSTYSFSGYDNGINVESYDLFKDFFDHLVYLPSVKVQKNNPHKIYISSTQNEFDITYDYTYHSNHLPQGKVTTIKKIRGDNAGLVTTSNSTYSYY